MSIANGKIKVFSSRFKIINKGFLGFQIKSYNWLFVKRQWIKRGCCAEMNVAVWQNDQWYPAVFGKQLPGLLNIFAG